MNGYHPDFVGALVAGALFGVSIFAAVKIWPQPDRRKKAVLAAIGVAAVLSIVTRTVLRHFGI